MSIKRTARIRLAVLATGLTVIAAGLTIGANLPQQGVGAPTPTATCEEDQPCWDCATMGNHVCGTATDAGTAWQVWEYSDGARQLKVDPSRPYRVDYMMSTDGIPENTDTYDLVLTGKDGRSYVFRAAYTD